MKALTGWTVVTQRHPVLVYALARGGIFLAALVVLRLAGLHQLPLVLLALLLSALLSYGLLGRQRDAVSAVVDLRARRTRERLGRAGARSTSRFDAAAASEDDDEDD